MNNSVLEFRKRQEWRRNPVLFMNEVLGLELAIHQKKMLEAILKYNDVTVRSANGVGKSMLLAAIAIWFFVCHLEDDKNPTIVVFTAPTFQQVKENIYQPIKALVDTGDKNLKNIFGPDAKPLLGKITENQNLAEIRIGHKNYIMGVSSAGENKVVGKHGSYVLAIFDEAQGITDKFFSDFEGITLSGDIVKKVMIGNTTLPDGNFGPFYSSFLPGSNYKQIHIPCFDTPNFILPNIKLEDYLCSEDDDNFWRNKLDRFAGTDYYKFKKSDDLAEWEYQIKQALKPWSSWLVNPITVYNIFQKYGGSVHSYEFKTRCLAEFPSGDEFGVFPQEWIDGAMFNYNNDSLWQPGEITMGVDVAQGTGADNSAIAIRNGNKIIYAKIFDLELFQLIEKIKEIYAKYNVSKIYIEKDGVGRDKFLILQQSGLPVVGIQTGGGAGLPPDSYVYNKEENDRKKKEFTGKRAEIWWHFRELMNPLRPKIQETKGQLPLLLPDSEMLRQELSAITYSRTDAGGKIKIISKEALKDKIDRSSDLADSIVFACSEMNNSFYMPCAFGSIQISSTRDRNIY